MPGFEELQAIWQSQSSPPYAVEIDALRDSLREYGRRMNRLYVIKAAAIPIVAGYAVVFGHVSQAGLAVLAAVLVVAVTLIAFDWRNQRSIARLDFTTVSVAFIRRTIERLQAQRDPFGKGYWVLFAVLAAFENVWVASLPYPWTWRSRLLGHGLATALPGAALELGRFVRRRRFQRECRPLIERLGAIEKSLLEDSE